MQQVRERKSQPSRPMRQVVSGLAGALFAAGAVLAHSGASGVIKERMNLMEHLGDSMKALKPLVRSKSRFDSVEVAEIAGGMHEVAADIGTKFPEGSNQEPSEALPVIWEDWARFSGLVDDLRTESARLVEVARGGDQRATLQQFIALGKTCKACHTDFRVNKD